MNAAPNLPFQPEGPAVGPNPNPQHAKATDRAAGKEANDFMSTLEEVNAQERMPEDEKGLPVRESSAPETDQVGDCETFDANMPETGLGQAAVMNLNEDQSADAAENWLGRHAVTPMKTATADVQGEKEAGDANPNLGGKPPSGLLRPVPAATSPEPQTQAVVASDNKAATAVVPDDKTATAVVPDRKTATVIVPDRKTATVIVPDRKTATVAVTDRKAATAVVPDNKTAAVDAPVLRSTGKVPLPDADRPAISGELGSETRSEYVEKRTAGTVNLTSPENKLTTKMVVGETSLTADRINALNAAADIKEAMTGRNTKAPSSPAEVSGRPPVVSSETEGSVTPEMKIAETEGSGSAGARPIPKEVLTVANRVLQASRPDAEQRLEGVNAFDRGASPSPEKTASPVAGEKPATSSAEAFRDSNFSSIVERIAVTLRGNQSEARIALKPDHLGSLRVQIATENNTVSIRIMTEFAMARDLLESHLPQLKMELQQQGLEVDEFNVSFEEEQHHFRRDERRALAKGHARNRSGNRSDNEDRASDESRKELHRTNIERSSGIDYFA